MSSPDPTLRRAADAVIAVQYATVDLVRRKCHVGAGTATLLMADLVNAGVLGAYRPDSGDWPVLVDPEAWRLSRGALPIR